MALSNIFREPRREIIEQAFGIGVLVVWVGGAHWLVRWMGATSWPDLIGGTVVMSMVMGIFAGLFFLMHELGEAICGALAKMGADPRPRQRY